MPPTPTLQPRTAFCWLTRHAGPREAAREALLRDASWKCAASPDSHVRAKKTEKRGRGKSNASVRRSLLARPKESKIKKHQPIYVVLDIPDETPLQ
jgi:hypothetical protein